MDNDTTAILNSRAYEALAAASEAAHDAGRPDLEVSQRAEHARRAHELAAYARELLTIVRENQ
jgi:hypothetical protein